MTDGYRMVSVEAMQAVAAKVARDWGTEGYKIGLEEGQWTGGGMFVVTTRDGSRFWLFADPWGAVFDCSTAETLHEAWAQLRARRGTVLP